MAQHKDFGRGATRADVVLMRGYTGTPGVDGAWQDINDPAPPLAGQRIFWSGPQALGTPPQKRSGLDFWLKG